MEKELIYSKQFDENNTVECFINTDDLYYYWEFNLKGTENKTIDKFRISKKVLISYIPYFNTRDLRSAMRIVDVFRSEQGGLIFYLDKFGQIDIHKYTTDNMKEVIRIRNYELQTIDSINRRDFFVETKMYGNTVYCMFKPLSRFRNAPTLTKTDLNHGTSVITEIFSSPTLSPPLNEFDSTKIILTMDSAEYKYNGYGYRFFITSDDKVKVLDFDSTQAVYKLNFELSKPDEKNVNDLIEWDSSL
ncbi:hypothetical protein, partial [Myroides sp. DF42-4-2]|uniref:hypothetical protein n=1 Tax=Myroides sp. DF42-4-2 TaxID=2746726 RepID=UPI002575EAB1